MTVDSYATTPAQATHRTPARWLALGAVAGPVFFTIAWIVLGLLRPPTKTDWGVAGGVTGMLTQPISGLGIGPNAGLMNAAFVLSGLLLLAGVIGIYVTTRASLVCLVLLALAPLGVVWDGIFTLEGSIFVHLAGFLVATASPVVSFLVAGFFFRRSPRWRRFGTWLLLGSPLTLVLVVLYFVSFDQATVAAGHGFAGLTERMLAIESQAWFVVMGLLAFRTRRGVSA